MEIRNIFEGIQNSIPEDRAIDVCCLMRSIHCAIDLREWVTIESIALPPVPGKRANQWVLASLLARPFQLADGSPGISSPWGAIFWDAIKFKVLEKLDLREHLTLKAYRTFGLIRFIPVASGVIGERSSREAMLYKYLNAIFAAEPVVNLPDNLAMYYSTLLPALIYPFYWELLPDSKQWLLPNAPAVTIEPSQIPAPQSATEPQTSVKAKANLIESNSIIDRASDNHSKASKADITPIDLSGHLGHWSDTISALAGNLQVGSIIETVNELRRYQQSPGFRIAIIGEFNTGKSTLLNRLFNRDFLPVGILPTTAIPTLISYSEQEEIQLSLINGQVDIRRIERNSWNDLIAWGDEAIKLNKATARVLINENWLSDIHAELLDTPGAGDLVGDRARLTADLINRCDAAVMVISATKPMSLTEVSFLEEQVIKQHVPQILIVVSKFDEIEADKRGELLSYIRSRIALIAPGVAVLTSLGVEGGETDEQALSVIRRQITRMADQSLRRAWRSHQIAGSLLDSAWEVSRLAHLAAKAALLTAEARKQSIQKERETMKANDLVWEHIILDLDERRMRNIQIIRGRLEQTRGEILDALQFELKKAGDPKSWWERDLPYRLRREFIAIGRRIEDTVMKAVVADHEWLNRVVSERFGEKIPFTMKKEADTVSQTLKADEVPVSDINRYRLFSRVGLSVTSVVGMLIFGPLGIAVSAGAGVVNEIWIKKRVEEQQKALSGEVERVIDRVINEVCVMSAERFGALYAGIVTDMRKVQNRWHASKVKTLEIADKARAKTTVQFKSIEQQAESCAREIAAVLPICL